MDSRNPGQPQRPACSSRSAATYASFQRHRLSLAIVAAVGLMSASQGNAAGSCGAAHTVLGSAVTQPCTLGTHQSLTVTEAGSITFLEDAAVVVQHASPGVNRVINSGTLRGEQGIRIVNTVFTGKVQNTSTGVIEGVGEGLSLSSSTFTGNILNAGTISTTQAAALSLVNTTVNGNLSNSGQLTAQRNESYGRYALLISGSELTGDLRNSGAITSGSTSLKIEGSTLGGSLINSGTIGGVNTPMELSGSTIKGDFINYGAISASESGSYISGTVVEGRWVNHGRISASMTGLVVSGSTLKGGLLNAGTISGGSNTTIGNTVMGSFENTGTIYSGTGTLGFFENTVNGDFINRGSILTNNTGFAALALDGGAIHGNLINLGTVDAGHHGGNGILSDGGTQVTGDFINGGTITGSNGVVLTDMTIGGNLVNASVIETEQASDSPGDAVRLTGGHIGGSVINQGSLAADRDALNMAGTRVDGRLVNAGIIRAENGLYLYQVQVGKDLRNTGSITGSDRGLALIDSTVGERLVNDGRISGGIDPFTVLNSTVKGGVVNRGVITGGSGAAISNSTLGGDFVNQGSIFSYLSPTGIYGSVLEGRLSNYGTIGTQGDASAYSGLVVSQSTVKGEFTNAGKIVGAGTSYGLDIGGSVLEGRLVNRGSITGARALSITDSQVGSVANTGTLKGSDRGLSINGTSKVAAGLVNAGVISGSQYSLYVDPDSTLGNLYIAGNQTARFDGAVYAPATVATLYGDASYRMQAKDSWQVSRFVNRGTLILAAPSSRSATPATINGDYTQRGDAVLQTQVVDQTHYGKLVVSGTVSLPSQAHIDVDVASAGQPFKVSRLQDVLSAGSLQSDGTFAVTANSTLFDFAAVRDGNTVDLTLAAKGAAGARAAVAQSGQPGAQGAAGALDADFAKGDASSLAPYFVSATNSAEVAQAVAQTVPLGNAGLRASQAALGEISQALQARLVPASGDAPSLRNAPSLWAKPFTSVAQGARSSSAGGGQVIGMDTRVSSTQRVGLAFAYASGDTQADALGSHQDSRLDLWQLSGYNAYTLAPGTELMLYAGAGHNHIQGERNMALAGASGKAKADFDSLVASVGASLGHAYQLGEATRVVPSVRLDYNHIREQGYREQGSASIAPLLLSVDSRQTNQLIAGVDGRVEHQFSPGGARLEVNLGVGLDLINDANTVTARFAGAPGQRFETRAAQASPWIMRGGLSLVAPLTSSGAELSLSYNAQSRSDYRDKAATVALKVPF